VPRGAIEEVLSALVDARVEFVVAGGVAVVLQGHARLTADLDLVVRLEPENVLRALGALSRLGYRPRAPVPAEQFADAERRRTWIRDKAMRVFSLWSDTHRATPLDLFAEEPIPFAELAAAATRLPLGPITVLVASIPHLVRMKRAAGRPQDLEDIRVLEQLLRDRGEDDRG
jgi:predicted nucleotidyltransferase